jgi:hypothetical protein
LQRNNTNEKNDGFEKDILTAYETGKLKSTSPSKADLAKFKAAATGFHLPHPALLRLRSVQD